MQMLNRYLFSTVFLTGAAVLILEIAAVRILAPYYGSSLHVFSSVLTVILAALSLGYWYGGRRADKKHSIDELYDLITLSGLIVLILLVAAMYILPLFGNKFPVSVGPLIFSITLFFLPAFILGVVSPYIIKLQSLHTPTEEIGSVVGKTFFWGTMGSILGSIASGFWLIPTLGVELSITLVSIILVGLGIATPLFLNRPLHKKRLLVLTVVAIIFSSFFLQLTQARADNFVYYSDGLYSSIAIRDLDIYGRPGRLLNRDTNNSSAIFLDSTDLVFDYTQFATLYTHLKPDARTMLMLGGGAYTIPRTIHTMDPDIEIDVVEIEPVLFTLAQEYFDLPTTEKITNIPEDARVYLSRTDRKYDVIFSDLFGTNHSAPFHLTTEEYYTLLAQRLTDDGILIINYIGKPEIDAPSLTGSLVKTLTSVFPNTKGFMLRPAQSTKRQNIVFISRQEGTFANLPESLTSQSGFPLIFADMELKLSAYDLTREYLLTDDHAPVDQLMAQQK